MKVNLIFDSLCGLLFLLAWQACSVLPTLALLGLFTLAALPGWL